MTSRKSKGASEDPVQRTKDRAKAVWPLYVPTVISGTGTIASIAMSNKISLRTNRSCRKRLRLDRERSRNTRRRWSSRSERTRSWRSVTRSLRRRSRGTTQQRRSCWGLGRCSAVSSTRSGTSCATWRPSSARRTRSTLRSSAICTSTLDVFYDSVGLPHTSHSNELGWDSDRLLELVFTTVLSEDGRPCIAFGLQLHQTHLTTHGLRLTNESVQERQRRPQDPHLGEVDPRVHCGLGRTILVEKLYDYYSKSTSATRPLSN